MCDPKIFLGTINHIPTDPGQCPQQGGIESHPAQSFPWVQDTVKCVNSHKSAQKTVKYGVPTPVIVNITGLSPGCVSI